MTFVSSEINVQPLLKKAKADYYLSLTTDCFNDHSKFWKTIKSLQNKNVSSFPQKLKVSDSFISDTDGMSNAFNAHFKKAGHMFDEQSHDSLNGRTHSQSRDELPCF